MDFVLTHIGKPFCSILTVEFLRQQFLLSRQFIFDVLVRKSHDDLHPPELVAHEDHHKDEEDNDHSSNADDDTVQ